tara:strand:- start:986 stop:1444 length:459 start_codon:yes stop_codon:yes gene_type:complete
MNLILPYNKLQLKKIYYGKKMDNIIVSNSYFHNIHYSDNTVQINNVIIKMPLKNCKINEYFNKFNCSFDVSENANQINKIQQLERSILNNFRKEKTNDLYNEYKLTEQFKKGEIKFTSNEDIPHNNEQNILIKISGLWYNDISKGIIFKIYI